MDDDFRTYCIFISNIFIITIIIKFIIFENEIKIQNTEKSLITSLLSSFTKKNRILIYGTSIVIIITSLIGISKLEVENSFINYFNKETEIYKGMKKIDDDLGGTTPLNIILKFPKKKKFLMTNLVNGKMKMSKKQIKQNIGLLEIKWIKF